MPTLEIERFKLRINGVVQGVGFRPFIFNLAKSMLINGWVKNTGEGVQIELECSKDDLDSFVARVIKEAPALAFIREIKTEKYEYKGYKDFKILESINESSFKTLVSPDVSICKDCTKELFSEVNFRYMYPFINCTNCGPRFTLIKDIPYDRSNTTMDSFQMCSTCEAEYINPQNRRYHAQPIACEKCGPKLYFMDNKGNCIEEPNVLKASVKELSEGKILAVKGLGGYHLVCDAKNENAVEELRKRKHRDEKPFAVMAKDMETALKYCEISKEEAEWLESFQKPIVLLKKRQQNKLPEALAPGNPRLGVMLPYSPLHLLLFEKFGTKDENSIDILVMTSGNKSSEPICYKDSDAIKELGDISDFFISNNREIFTRTDDSVISVYEGKEYVIRRSRGFAPLPVFCDDILGPAGSNYFPSVLACGAEMKNTFCLNKNREFYLSHHIGDLENIETFQSFEEGIHHYSKLFTIQPEIVAYDLHPEYLSAKYALELKQVKKFGVQHHKAHIASCMAENNLDEPVIGVAFDGTGYGEDGNIWGGEFFTGRYNDFRRAGHLAYVRMPGGSAAIREPWRMACSYLNNIGVDFSFLNNISGMEFSYKNGQSNNINTIKHIDEFNTIKYMLETGFNSPLTSSMGRLFDAVSALIGIRNTVSFEGQAAMELEFAADMSVSGFYEYDVFSSNGVYAADVSRVIYGVVKDRLAGVSISVISSKFHETTAVMVHDICSRISKDTGIRNAVLSGGVFQNLILLSKCRIKLMNSGFRVYIHKRVPANDGGISLGQSVIAIADSQSFC